MYAVCVACFLVCSQEPLAQHIATVFEKTPCLLQWCVCFMLSALRHFATLKLAFKMD